MSDYLEVTRRGLGGRSKDSLGGAFVGLLFVALAVILLFWNEGRAVKRAKDLKEGAGNVVSVSSEKIDPAMEGKLVHLTGETQAPRPLEDSEFGVSAPAIKLLREVAVYQWVQIEKSEEKTKIGGSTEKVTTYSYQKEWKDSPVDSSQFKVTSGHENPREMKYRSITRLTRGIRVGGFFLLPMAFSMILRPLAVLASILPFLGRLVGSGTTLIAFLLTGILWTLTVAVAWIFYRPLLGIAFLVVSLLLTVLVVKCFRKSSPALATAPLIPGGPPPLS